MVIRSRDIERAGSFYEILGLRFESHLHDGGPEHYASAAHGFVFEIYPQQSESATTTNTRIEFRVDSVDTILKTLAELDFKIVSPSQDSEWGRLVVVKDYDGHTIELLASSAEEEPC